MREVVIAPQQEGKGRTFRALLLASVEADSLWTGGQTNVDDMRPVWAMFAGSDQEMRPFAANLISGRKVIFLRPGGPSYSRGKEDRLELLRSAGYHYTWQREVEGSVLTVFLPDLFQLDPGMVDTTGARFICLPRKSWRDEQKIDNLPAIVGHALALGAPMTAEALAEIVPLAFLFCAYLDRRTRCPLLPDGRFCLQLMLAFLAQGMASWSTDSNTTYRGRGFGENSGFKFTEHDTANVGLTKGIAFNADHATIERVMAEQVSAFFAHTRGS